MKTDARAALGRLREMDNRAAAVIAAVALFMAFAVYMLVAENPGTLTEARETVRVYEPVDSIARFRDERERVRKAETEQLNALISEGVEGDALRDTAREKLIQLTDWMEQEVTVEGLLRVRGFLDPLVTVHQDSVNVLIRAETLTQSDAARILDIAVRETGQGSGNIKIIPVP